VDDLGVACVWGDPGWENSGAAMLASASSEQLALRIAGSFYARQTQTSKRKKSTTCMEDAVWSG
jgi:hypothetical protein